MVWYVTFEEGGFLTFFSTHHCISAITYLFQNFPSLNLHSMFSYSALTQEVVSPLFGGHGCGGRHIVLLGWLSMQCCYLYKSQQLTECNIVHVNRNDGQQLWKYYPNDPSYKKIKKLQIPVAFVSILNIRMSSQNKSWSLCLWDISDRVILRSFNPHLLCFEDAHSRRLSTHLLLSRLNSM